MSHHDHHAHEHGQQPHGSFKGYITGFILSVILTAIPFYLVMEGVIESKLATSIIVVGFAIVQMIIHMIYFLHMNMKSENGWTVLAFIFTLVLVIIMLSGSVWVMYHLNTNMMPGHNMEDMQ